MKTIYVNLKSEVTGAMHLYQRTGHTVYRVRTECSCTDGNNRRNGIIAVLDDRIVYKVIRCKGCVNRELELAKPGKEAEHGTI